MSDSRSTPYVAEAAEDVHAPCRRCGRTPARTQSYMYVMSFLVFTRRANYEDHLCRKCATSTALREHAKSALWGWWGIPWGLLTFGALWVNTRALLRWSTLGAPVALLAGLAGLALPVGAGWYFFRSAEEQRRAEATGDWVSDEVFQLVEEGHRRLGEGDLDAGLELYLAAHAGAPRSSAVNSSIAHAYLLLGRPHEALRYAGSAADLAPESIDCLAIHGLTLAALGRETDARERAERMRALPIETEDEANWVLDLAQVLEDPEWTLLVADRGLELAPTADEFRAGRLDALEGLDRIEEMGEFLGELSDDGTGEVSFFRDLHSIRTEPVAFLPALFEDWTAGRYSLEGMTRLATGASRAGAMTELRPKIRDWLFSRDTPGDAWFVAEPWFPEDRWTAELDDYLEERVEVAPVLLRVGTMDRAEDSKRILELASRARSIDHALIEHVDGAYFYARFRESGWPAYLDEMNRHLQAHPDHFFCRLGFLRFLSERDLERTGVEIERLRTDAADVPPLLVACSLLRAEFDALQGRARDAVETVRATRPWAAEPFLDAGEVNLLVAEVAFHAGDQEALRRRVGREAESELEAAELLVRWMNQIARGRSPSYDRDVREWLDRQEGDPKSLPSATAQGILLAEGLVDRAWAERVAGPWRTTTLDLVSLVKTAGGSEARALDRKKLGELAALDDGPFAVRLARTTVARLPSAPGKP